MSGGGGWHRWVVFVGGGGKWRKQTAELATRAPSLRLRLTRAWRRRRDERALVAASLSAPDKRPRRAPPNISVRGEPEGLIAPPDPPERSLYEMAIIGRD